MIDICLSKISDDYFYSNLGIYGFNAYLLFLLDGAKISAQTLNKVLPRL